MTAHEALWLMKVQLQRTEQNIQAIKVLEDIVKSVSRLRIDDEEIKEGLTTNDDINDDIDYVWVNNYTLDEALDEVYGTEAQHIKNHMAKVGTKDIQELEKVEQTCARYDLVEDDSE
jgi:hypothetical protein